MDQKIEKSREAITTDYELEVNKLRDRLYSSLNIPNAVDYTCGDEQEAQSKGMMWSLNDYLVQKFKELKFDCDDNSNLNDKLNQKVLKLDKENREWQGVNEKMILEH